MKIKNNSALVGERVWVAHTIERLIKQNEEIFFTHLKDLIEQGLLEIEAGPAHIVQEENVIGETTFSLARSVRFFVKNAEYIKALEHKINELEDQIESYRLGLD